MQKNILLKIQSNKIINDYLSDADPIMADIIHKCTSVSSNLETNYFEKLCKIIIGQQLSNKVANIICNRFVILCDFEVTPKKIDLISEQELRNVGISFSKISYLKNLSQDILKYKILLDDFSCLTNDEIIKILTSVKGIGQWSAEMFLIFSLGRMDVFSYKDGGLKRMIETFYDLPSNSIQKNIEDISNKWIPYRTIASLYLWDLINKDLIKEVQFYVNKNG